MWEVASNLEKVYWCIAVPFSFLLIFQLILSVLGGFSAIQADHHVTDHNVDGNPHFQFLTIRNIIAFLTMFGWIGIACIHSKFPIPVTFLLSFLAGLITALLVGFLFVAMAKLVHSGNSKIEDTIGKTGSVYLPIEPNKTKAGKVNVVVNDRKIVYEALTEDSEKLTTGTLIKIVKIENQTLIVQKLE